MSKKPEVIIFGAGKGGERALKFLRRRFKVVAFCDNNQERHGDLLLGRPILSPAQLAEEEGARVFIASQYAMEIYLQLTNELKVSKERIEIVPDIVLVGEHDTPWLGLTGLGVIAALIIALFVKLLS